MKPEDIFNAITDIRDDQIEYAKPTHSRKWYSVPIAACLALALIALPFLRARSPGVQPLYTGTAQLAAARCPDAPEDSGPYADGDGDELWESISRAQTEYYQHRDKYSQRLGSFWADSAETFLTADHEQNLVFSPISLYTILGMSAELCQGETRQEILDLLQSPDIEDMRESANRVWCASYSSHGDSGACLLANSLWLSNAVDYNQPVLDILAENYFADSFRGDMGSPEYDALHLEWLDEKTNGYLTGRLPELSTPENTLIYLDSTLYFKAGWADEFDPSDNLDGTFHATYMDEPCTFMRTSGTGWYYWGQHFTATSKTLSGGRMLFVLPDEGTTVNQLLADEEYHRFIGEYPNTSATWENFSYARINYSIPKFDITSDMDMTLGLKQMGISGIFESGSGSFTPLTRQDFAFTSVSHTCRVSIDEDGCEGAAVSVMPGITSEAPPEDELDFTLDRPFLFTIINNNGLPVYMGVVNRMSE